MRGEERIRGKKGRCIRKEREEEETERRKG